LASNLCGGEWAGQDEGVEHGIIARAVGKHPNTVTSYLKEYEQ